MKPRSTVLRRRLALSLLVTAIGAAVFGQTAFSAPGGGQDFAPPGAEAQLGTAARDAVRTAVATARRSRPQRFVVARVHRGVGLCTRPGGPVDARIGPRTQFGSPQVLGVAAVRRRWLGVVTTARPNGKLAWVERGNPALRLSRTSVSLRVDLSSRTVTLRRGGRNTARLRVAVGRKGSPTPTGRFAVTDKLRGSRFGAYYGCCILALSGYQPHPPPGWRGGNRLAIHGTNAPGTIGRAASAGCLRAADRDLQLLMRRVPLGTPVFIRR